MHFSACEESLELLPPDGLVKDEYWKLKEDVMATLMGAYQQLSGLDQRLFYYGELRADMLEPDVSLGGSERSIMNGNIFQDNWLCDWESFYSVINYCNTVIKYAPDVKALDPTYTDYQYNANIAEAVFLRSLVYFYLVRVFDKVPLVMNPSDEDDQNFFPQKTDGEVILDSVKIHLQNILSSIPDDYETIQITRGRATQGAVNALLADISLWLFEYEECIQYAERVERNQNYELVPGGRWFTLFSEGNTLEGIFEIQYDTKLNQNNGLYGITNPQSNVLLASSKALDYLSPELTGEQTRGNGSLRFEDQVIWKYCGRAPDRNSIRSSAERSSANFIIYRLADVLLMKAEALSQIERYDEALMIVNEIRTRAFMPPVDDYPRTPQAYEDMILDERVRELAFEGKRWFDLLRMGRRNNYARKGKLIEIIIESVPATQKRVLASKLTDANGWYLPIYDQEMERNINLVQNPYYQAYEKD